MSAQTKEKRDKLLDRRNLAIFMVFNWDTVIEGRRSEVVFERLEGLFFISKVRLSDIMRGDQWEKWSPSEGHITQNEVFKWKIFTIVCETTWGNKDIHHVLVNGVQVESCRSLSDAKQWMGLKAKWIIALLALSQMEA